MRIAFEERGLEWKRALAVSFDLSGFSSFCTHPESQHFIKRLISSMFDELNSRFHGSLGSFCQKGTPYTTIREPDFSKYSGDGALMLWFLPEKVQERRDICTAVVGIMRVFKLHLDDRLRAWKNEWGVPVFPTISRFGFAMGKVLELREPSSVVINFGARDYVGYCINLAVRLQDYRQGASFVIHETVAPEIERLKKIKATGMKGVLDENVLVFPEDQVADAGADKAAKTSEKTSGSGDFRNEHPEAYALIRNLVQHKRRKFQLDRGSGGTKYDFLILDGEGGEGFECDEEHLPEDLDTLVANGFLKEDFGNNGAKIYTITRNGDRIGKEPNNPFVP